MVDGLGWHDGSRINEPILATGMRIASGRVGGGFGPPVVSIRNKAHVDP